MPGAFRVVYVIPRYGYAHDGGIFPGTAALQTVLGRAPIVDWGCYALESTAAQNIFDYAVYSSDAPYVTFRPDYRWNPEGRLMDHRSFQPLMGRFPIPCHRGGTHVPIILDNLCGLARKTMFVLSDYSGSIDSWINDNTMLPGSYAHYRLVGCQRQEDWWRCHNLQFLGYRRGDRTMAGTAML